MNTKPKTLKLMPGLAAACITMAPMMAAAEDVRLRSSDGSIDIVGEFIEYSANRYVIQTALGALQISGERVSCEGSACPIFETVDADVIFAGAETVGEGVMPLLLEGFAGNQQALATITTTSNRAEVIANIVGDDGFGEDIGNFLVRSSNSDAAFQELLENTTDVAMSSRRIVPEEARALRAAGAGNMIDPSQENIVAVDSLVVITHPNNPVESLSFEQLTNIYAGEITNWSQVGGANAPISVISAEENTGSRRVFESGISGSDAFDLTDQATILGSNTDIAVQVNANENAIGYVSYAFQRGAKPMVLINECGIPTVADAFSARTEEYALQQRLYFYTRADDVDPKVDEFVSFALSAEADNLIAKAGFIDLGVAVRAQPEDGMRATMLRTAVTDAYEGAIVDQMLESMVGYDRLSTTFRFSTGSSRLNERGQVDMIRLANFLENQPAGTQVRFVGFTDSVGAFDANRDLSFQRAAQALDKFRSFASGRLGSIEMDHVGFGEIAPVGCNVTDAGRRTNRRVEVWVNAPA